MNQSHCSSIIIYIEKLQWSYRNQFNMNWTLYKPKIQFEVSKVLKNYWIYLLKYKRSSDMEEVVLVRTDGTSVCVQDGGARGLNCRENRQEVARKRKPCGVAASRGSPLQRMWSEEEEEEGRVRARGAFFYIITRKSGLSSGQYCDLLRGHADDGVQGTLPRTLQALRILRRRQNGHLRSRRQKQTARWQDTSLFAI